MSETDPEFLEMLYAFYNTAANHLTSRGWQHYSERFARVFAWHRGKIAAKDAEIDLLNHALAATKKAWGASMAEGHGLSAQLNGATAAIDVLRAENERLRERVFLLQRHQEDRS